LRWLFYNVPQGTDFIKVGKQTATVALELADGTKIARERSKTVNRYRIVKPGESPTVLEGFGTSVPVEVQEATGVRMVSIGDTIDLALNLSEQLDGPFLGKAVSGPAKAKILGALAGTEEVDKAQQDVSLDLHRASQDEKRIADEIEILDARIKDYDYLPALAEQIESLESILAAVKEAQTRLYSLEVAKTKIDTIHEQRTQMLNILARWGGLAAAVSHVEYAEGALAKMQALSGYKASLASIETQSYEQGQRLARWLYLEDAAGLYAVAEQTWHRMMNLAELNDDLTVTRAGVAKAQAVVQKWAVLHEATVAEAKASDAVSWLKDLLPLRERLEGVRQQRIGALAAQMRWAALSDAEAVISAIPALQERLNALCSLRQTLIEIHGGRVIAEQNLSMHTKALGDAQSLYADTLIQLGTCPLCGSAVDPESISLHIKEVA